MPEIGFHSSLEDLLKATRFAVEATSFERLALWQKHHETLAWQDRPYGFMVTLGRFGDMPVVLSVTFHVLENHVVMFYEATSQVVDHRMVEAWVDKHVCAKWDQNTLRPRTDAMNFHLCVHALAELNQPAPSLAVATPA